MISESAQKAKINRARTDECTPETAVTVQERRADGGRPAGWQIEHFPAYPENRALSGKLGNIGRFRQIGIPLWAAAVQTEYRLEPHVRKIRLAMHGNTMHETTRGRMKFEEGIGASEKHYDLVDSKIAKI